MTQILINFVLIFTIICCELKAAHSRTTQNNIRNARSITNALKSEDLIQLTNLRRPIIINQGEIDNHNCAPFCEYFEATENKTPKNYTGVSGLNCYGWLDSCRRFGSQNDAKNPPTYCYTKKERHLIWAKDEFHTTFRNTTGKCIKKTLPLYLTNINNHECNICLCMCTEESNDPESKNNWAFSLLPQESDIDNNKVVTGVRIRTHGKLIYLQIEEGQINSDNENNWKPFSPPENLVLNEDYSLLEPNIRFTRISNTNSNDRGYVLSMEVQGTEFNFTTRKLIKDTRTWYNSHTTPTSSADYKRARIELSMDDITSSSLTNADNKFYESNTYIKFGPENRRNDTGQFTIPYLSVRNVQSPKVGILNGIGLFYRKPGHVGFIEPELYYNYARNFMNHNAKIKSNNDNNIGTKSSENIIGNSEAIMEDDIDNSATESLIEDSGEIEESVKDDITKHEKLELMTRGSLLASNIDGDYSVMNKTKQDLNKKGISKPRFIQYCKMIEVTTEESIPEAITEGERIPAAFLKHSSYEYTNEELQQDLIEPPSEKPTNAPTTEVVTEETMTKTSTESSIIEQEQTLQFIAANEPVTDAVSTEDTGISTTGMMENNEADEDYETTSEVTTKILEEEKIVTESATEIDIEEQRNIIQEHLMKESIAVVSTTEEDVTKGSVNEINNLVKPQSQSVKGSATALKNQIMFYVITLLVIISLV
ncbi:hypothetical protein PV328_003404 [Microctonus aethiopoides]|uniref:Uncharacterized protein n=1 Tax=Microctonus aethiopoides TaxID=144406 RepID=A0AA39KKM0_9HYME|nr:hypothetical protein PV328_003404 [Microctonus aethiopoides]